VIDQTTAARVADVERAISFVPRARDSDIHDLAQKLRKALENGDERALRREAVAIMEHATNRYLAVVEEADRLIRHLGESPH
jgi:hypothetical protein